MKEEPKPEVNFKVLENIFTRALKRLLKEDSFLLENDVNERSITHKLAEYLQRELREGEFNEYEFNGYRLHEYNVDCEYNRMDKNGVQDTKRLELHSLQIIEDLKKACGHVEPDDTNAKTVFPDIIIHRREDSTHNLLVVEIKKSNSDQNSEMYDLMKILGYLQQLRYEYGLLIKFQTGWGHDKPIGILLRKIEF